MPDTRLTTAAINSFPTRRSSDLFSLERDHSLLESSRYRAVPRKKLEPRPVELKSVGLGRFCGFRQSRDDFLFVVFEPVKCFERAADEPADKIRFLRDISLGGNDSCGDKLDVVAEEKQLVETLPAGDDRFRVGQNRRVDRPAQ